MKSSAHSNALIQETSPYLLQHAHNPVQWYPWGEQALQKARLENKPILLSIGYSACHWCHVMAHESFENEMTAEIMNEHFVNIKIDREERPDIDKIYQTAQQLLTQRTGGWPLTMFLTPDDHLPFFGGTYFPPTGRHGLPGFNDLLLRVAEYFGKHRDEIREQNQAMQATLKQLSGPPAGDRGVELDLSPVQAAVAELSGLMDRRHGGFGGAPKFPHPTNIDVLLGYDEGFRKSEPEQATQARDDALFTLHCMARGGIYDQLGGGFCRYSVDDTWTIPHFEKMLYDNGQLLGNYADAFHVSDDPLFQRIAVETAEWVMRDMQAPEGGYYSSLDADSEGEEGRFYVWTPEQLRELLTAEEYAAFAPRFGLDGPANFEGHWHLECRHSIEEVAKSLSMPPAAAELLIDSARKKLLAVRSKRIWPGRDDKILTSWNGLMIKGMAIAARGMAREDFADSAERALQFIHDKLWHDGRLLATCKDGKAHLNAYLDDHAFLIDAILHLLSCRWSTQWLGFAIELADVLLQKFEDAENGGFFFTAHDHEQLIQRRKDLMDDALPSGNGIAALALLRLGHLIGETRYIEAAERTLRAAWTGMQRVPHAHNSMLLASAEYCAPRRQLVIRCATDQSAAWNEICRTELGLRDGSYIIPDNAGVLPGLLGERQAEKQSVAYLCSGFSCQAPVRSADELRALIR